MANCDNIVFWSPVPSGSIFKVKAAGDKNVFDITVGRSMNGANQTPVGFKSLVPGPASQEVVSGQRWVFTCVVSLFSTPSNPVTLDAWVEDAQGNKVQLPDADGAPQDLDCDWAFATVGANMVKIFVGA